MSANTTILNDDLVKDEIVTISTGAIKEYSILSETEKTDGSGFMVTTKATVSLPHLITYAKNHGSECEFAGNTFGMQMKLWEIQKENERKIFEHLLSQIEKLLPTEILWELKVSEPILKDYCGNGCHPLENLARYATINDKGAIVIFAYSMFDKQLDKNFLERMKEKLAEEYCEVRFDISNYFSPYLMELIYNTMKNVSMTSEEYRNRDKMNNYNDHMSVIEIDPISGNSRKNYIYLRNNYASSKIWSDGGLHKDSSNSATASL